MINIKETIKDAKIISSSYGHISRRSFLKGALVMGGALALAGCANDEPVTKTVTETVTNTVTKTVTVVESAPTVPVVGEATNMVTVPSVIIPEYVHCEGCNLCMIACSFAHGGKGDMERSNIQVYAMDIKSGMVDIPILCMKCNDAPCKAVCPDKVQAISIDEVTGAMILDAEKCTACGLCVEACAKDRTGCLRLSRNGDEVLGMCDLCDGNPECVQVCPANVLTLIRKTMRGETFAHKPYVVGEDVWNTLYR